MPINGNPPRNRGGGKPFQKGCAPGPGNPHSAEVSKFRAALYRCVTPADFEAVVKALVEEAKAKKAWAIRELLDRVIGKAPQAVHLTGSADEEVPEGVTLADIQLCVWDVLSGHDDLRVQLAQRLRELHERAESERVGGQAGPGDTLPG